MFSIIEETFPKIEEKFSKKELFEFVSCGFAELSRYHFGLGKWIRNDLLRNNEKLKEVFSVGGVVSSDDASSLIIRLFYIYERNKLFHRQDATASCGR